jgi:hypoxanthine phosphoribosyltransferase
MVLENGGKPPVAVIQFEDMIPPEPKRLKGDLHEKQVLIVDDEFSGRQTLESVLEGEGYEHGNG